MGSNLPDNRDDAQDEALADGPLADGPLDDAKSAEQDAEQDAEPEAVEPFDKPQAPDNGEKGPEFFRNPEGGPLVTEDPGPQDTDAPAES